MLPGFVPVAALCLSGPRFDISAHFGVSTHQSVAKRWLLQQCNRNRCLQTLASIGGKSGGSLEPRPLHSLQLGQIRIRIWVLLFLAFRHQLNTEFPADCSPFFLLQMLHVRLRARSLAPSLRLGCHKRLKVGVNRTDSTSVYNIIMRVRDETVTMCAGTREEPPDDDWVEPSLDVF
jgi:hypothetical protein